MRASMTGNRGAKAVLPVAAFLMVTSPAVAAESTIPAHLSVGGMFLQADWVVKLVMIGLMIASVVTWTVLVAKALELRQANAAHRAVHDGVATLR